MSITNLASEEREETVFSTRRKWSRDGLPHTTDYLQEDRVWASLAILQAGSHDMPDKKLNWVDNEYSLEGQCNMLHLQNIVALMFVTSCFTYSQV